jgi:3-polyprenyl-4-hydroxybenzoate decarboxylase
LKDYRPFGDHNRTLEMKLRRAGINGIRGAYTIAWPGFNVVSLTQLYEGHVEDVVRVIEPGGEQYSGNHVWVLVDDDIEITSPREVLWAIASRLVPEHGVSVIPGEAHWQLDPRIPPWQRSSPDAEHGRQMYSAHNLVLNACRPFGWKDQFPPVNMSSRESRRAVEEKWGSLFARVKTEH